MPQLLQQQCVCSLGGGNIIPWMGWAHVRVTLHWLFQHLFQAGIFLSFHNAFQQGAKANFQVFPVFLLSDAPKAHCCKITDPLPSVCGVWGHSLQMTQRPGLLLEKQHLSQREADSPFSVLKITLSTAA